MATHDTNNWSDLLDVVLFEADPVTFRIFLVLPFSVFGPFLSASTTEMSL